MAERCTPEALIREVAAIVSQQDTLEGVFLAAERCLFHLESDALLDPGRAVQLAAFLLETAAELLVEAQPSVPTALLTLLDRKRGRIGATALSQRYQSEQQSFSAENRPPADRPRRSEPSNLPEADRALMRDIQRSIQELSATR